jgi:uncharacterized membrane protein YkvA (DUF1232 family)
MFEQVKNRIRDLKREVVALYFAARDPEAPLMAKLVAGFVAAYALSPIDLIPDFIPVLGYLDDLIIVPLGIMLAARLVPDDVMNRARKRAESVADQPRSTFGLMIIVSVWLLAIAAFTTWFLRRK